MVQYVDHVVSGKNPTGESFEITIRVPAKDSKLGDLIESFGEDRVRFAAVRQIVQDLANAAREDHKQGGRRAAKEAAVRALEVRVRSGDQSAIDELVALLKG